MNPDSATMLEVSVEFGGPVALMNREDEARELMQQAGGFFLSIKPACEPHHPGRRAAQGQGGRRCSGSPRLGDVESYAKGRSDMTAIAIIPFQDSDQGHARWSSALYPGPGTPS